MKPKNVNNKIIIIYNPNYIEISNFFIDMINGVITEYNFIFSDFIDSYLLKYIWSI